MAKPIGISPVARSNRSTSQKSLNDRPNRSRTSHPALLSVSQGRGTYLTIPLIEVGPTQPQPRYFNTICLADPHGQLVVHYRNFEPWPHAEKSWATPSNRGLQTFDTEYGRVGLTVCFDVHPVVQRYREHHWWALLYSVAWVDSDYPAE